MLAQMREQTALAVKKASKKLAKQKAKNEKKYMREAQEKAASTRQAANRVREVSDKVLSQKHLTVMRMKEQAIREEILRIGEKDLEAKNLEKREKKILKRLRETHSKQQEAIEEI